MDPTSNPQRNPYQPPQAQGSWSTVAYPPSQHSTGRLHPPFKPIELYGLTAGIAMVISAACGFLMDAAIFVTAWDSSYSKLLKVILAGVGSIQKLASLLAIVFFLTWVHAAASNVRTFGRSGLQYTPGWCVGWFFVPLANLVMPYRILSGIWSASEPETGLGIQFWRSTPLLLVWWSTYLASRLTGMFISFLAGGLTGYGVVGLIGNSLSTVAAVSIILVMREVAANQTKMATSFPSHHPNWT